MIPQSSWRCIQKVEEWTLKNRQNCSWEHASFWCRVLGPRAHKLDYYSRWHPYRSFRGKCCLSWSWSCYWWSLEFLPCSTARHHLSVWNDWEHVVHFTSLIKVLHHDYSASLEKKPWQYIYDSDRGDKLLTWNNKRFVYPKRKSDTTFNKLTGHPRHTQASIDYKRNATLAITQTTEDTTHSGIPRGTQPRQNTPRTWHIWAKQKVKPTLAANMFTQHPRHNSKADDPKDSDKRSIKWQPQERLKIRWWTEQHLDVYLALAEVACEWNIEPG
jgi:hypothetical protein